MAVPSQAEAQRKLQVAPEDLRKRPLPGQQALPQAFQWQSVCQDN